MESKRTHERFYLSYYLKVIDRQTNLSVGHCVNVSDGGMMVIRKEPIKTKNIFQLKNVFTSAVCNRTLYLI